MTDTVSRDVPDHGQVPRGPQPDRAIFETARHHVDGRPFVHVAESDAPDCHPAVLGRDQTAVYRPQPDMVPRRT